jgi:hypothetical protein
VSLTGVSGHREYRPAWFASGLLAGGAVTGIVLAGIAQAASTLPERGALAALGVGLALAAADLAGGRGLTFPRRQTFSGAAAYAGPRSGQFIWGADLGLGFTTYRVSRLYWSGLVMLVSGASPVLCLVGPLVYSASLFASITYGKRSLPTEERILRRRRRFAILGAAVIVSLIGVVVAGG